MLAPKLPDNEQERLYTLRSLNILDTAEEDRFDKITRLTKHIFDVPIAVVSLLDENRQWFKSCIGLPVRETDRTVSFCGHAILDDIAFVIPNALEDPRFSDNPLVVDEPHIRFYAGYPIHAPNNIKLGTLCIIDTKPRKISDAELNVLRDFAELVEREIAITYLATIDELTEITNRRGFMMMAEHELSRCSRDDLAVSLVYFDINHFKSINDNHGHSEGDQALLRFVKAVKEGLRGSDMFGRLGGDEFVLMLSETSETQAETVIERTKELLEQLHDEPDSDYELNFAAGVVTYDPTVHSSVEDLLNAADQAMYKNKASQSK